jgi:hypothetical protein
MAQDLFLQCSSHSDFQLDPHDTHSSTRKYAELFIVAEILYRSRFLKMLIEDRNRLNSERKDWAEKLKRRLGKICQYVSGIGQVIRRVKRLFPNGNIPYRWVQDTFVGTGEGQFSLCTDAYQAVWRAFGSSYLLSQETLNKLATNFPYMLDNWARGRLVTPCIHAEIRIILHLSSPSPLHTSRRHIVPSIQLHAIGCCKRTCFCCTLWIDAYNEIYKTQWLTSGSHGKPYANWALPGPAYMLNVDEHGRSDVDAAVLRGVSQRLTDTLAWLLPGQKRISDEHVSSDDGSSDSEERPDYQAHALMVARGVDVMQR